MKNQLFILLIAALSLSLFPTCKQGPQSSISLAEKDRVFNFTLGPLRLGDGVPLQTEVYVRWTIHQPTEFYQQFASADSFQYQILYPRSQELAKQAAGLFPSVDSVFYNQRSAFLESMKETIQMEAGDDLITIKEVIISDLRFPVSYTQAMEKKGLHRQELELIEQLKKVELAKAEANREKAQAEAQLRIVQEEANAKVQLIKAKTEANTRKNALAKAETQAQLKKRKTEAEAKSVRLMAEAEADRKRLLAEADLEQQERRNQLEFDKDQRKAKADREAQTAIANIYQEYPNYATTLIYQQLAAKVNLAILPSETNQAIFKQLFEHTMPDIK